MSSTSLLRRSLRFRVLAVFVFAALVLYRVCFYPTATPTWLPLPVPGTAPAGADQDAAVYRTNATLGFGAIYVVSGNNSPRRHGLLQAANVTELEFTIPSQPVWPEATLARHPKLGKGSLMAWLGHLHTLRQFIASGAETALVLEDDVDWDIHLRSLQAPLVATAVRALLSPDLHPATDLFPTPEAAAQRYPYGTPAHWDLLYLGHCGDYFHGMDRGFDDGHVHPSDLAREEHISFNDSSLPAPSDLHPWTSSLLRNLGVPPHTRLVHRSVFPLCTFAYAVTRSAARRMVEDLVSLEEEAHTAYDVAILIACRDKGLKCYTVNPELFHHVPGKSMIGNVDNNTHLPPVDAMAQKQVELRHETPNIGCGFWGGGFAFPDGDARQLEYLRTEVGRKGRCLKKGR